MSGLETIYSSAKIYGLATRIASEAHANKFRKGKFDQENIPHFYHPYMVATMVSNPIEHTEQGRMAKIVAILHDILVDTNETPETLIAKGIPREVVDIVEILTKKPKDVNLTHLRRIKKNPVALRVKLADLMNRLLEVPNKREIKKCIKGIAFLLECDII